MEHGDQFRSDLPGCEDRRTNPRLIRRLPVTVFYSGHSQRSHILDLSLTGLRLVSRGSIPEDELTLILELSPEICLRLLATPVWQESMGPDGTHVVGLVLREDQPYSTAELDRWLSDQGVAA